VPSPNMQPRPSWYAGWARVRAAGWRWVREEARWEHTDGRMARSQRVILAHLDGAPLPQFVPRLTPREVEIVNERIAQTTRVREQWVELGRRAQQRRATPPTTVSWFQLAPSWQPNAWEA
jgi:hypothetical protein